YPREIYYSFSVHSTRALFVTFPEKDRSEDKDHSGFSCRDFNSSKCRYKKECVFFALFYCYREHKYSVLHFFSHHFFLRSDLDPVSDQLGPPIFGRYPVFIPVAT